MQTTWPPCVCTRKHFVSVCAVDAPHYGCIYACVCLCVRSVYVSPCPFSRRRPFTMLLIKSHGKHGGEGGECVCCLCKRMCVLLVFLPSRLLSRGLNWGPGRPINGEPAWPFGMANMWWPNIMFSSPSSPVPPPLPRPPQPPTQGTSS